jgi:hypothetical protein
MRFVYTEDGSLVNLAHVHEIKPTAKGDRFLAKLADDHVVISVPDIDRLVVATAPLIPAHPGFEVLEFYFDASLDAQINLETFDIASQIIRSPVIGWIITDGQPLPISPGMRFSTFGESFHGFHAVKWPDGQIDLPDDQTFPNLDAWVVYVRAQCKLRKQAA